MSTSPEDIAVAPEAASFCVPPPTISIAPIIRFPGGGTLEPAIDPGRTGVCALSADLIGQVSAAIAPFSPFLQLLDVVSTMVNCFLLMAEAISNPFKIPDLLGCMPNLVRKFTELLGLVPAFPQGAGQIVRFVHDVVLFTAAQVACAIEGLDSVLRQLEEVTRLLARAAECDDASIRAAMIDQAGCATDAAASDAEIVLQALGPIARLLCAVKTLLGLVPGGLAIAKQISFPAVSVGGDGVAAIRDARDALATLQASLTTAADVLRGFASGLGVDATVPAPGFVCPIDSAPDEAPETPVPEPEILFVAPEATAPAVLPPPVLPAYPGGPTHPALALSTGDPDTRIVLFGSGFEPGVSTVFWGLARLESAVVSPTRMTAVVPRTLLRQDIAVDLTVVNTPSGGKPFSGIAAPGETATSVLVSNQYQAEVA